MTSLQGPQLSIVIPTYNRPQELRRLLCALSRQIDVLPSGLVEICISDNGANVDTHGASRDVFGKPYVKLHIQSENKGFDRNCIDGFRMATGRYVWFIGDDDMPDASAVSSILNITDAATPVALLLNSRLLADLERTPAPTGAEIKYTVFSTDFNRLPTLVARKIGFLSGHVVETSAGRNVLARYGEAHFMGSDFAHVALFLECCRNRPEAGICYVETPLIFSEPERRRFNPCWIESRLHTDLNGYRMLFAKYCPPDAGQRLLSANAAHVLRDFYQLSMVSSSRPSWTTYMTVARGLGSSGLLAYVCATTILQFSPKWLIFSARAIKRFFMNADRDN